MKNQKTTFGNQARDILLKKQLNDETEARTQADTVLATAIGNIKESQLQTDDREVVDGTVVIEDGTTGRKIKTGVVRLQIDIVDKIAANTLAIDNEATDRTRAIGDEATLRVGGDASTLASAQTYTDESIADLLTVTAEDVVLEW